MIKKDGQTKINHEKAEIETRNLLSQKGEKLEKQYTSGSSCKNTNSSDYNVEIELERTNHLNK